MKDIKMEMEILLLDESLERTLVQIHAARSFYGHANSATFQSALSDEKTLANLSKKRLELRLSLEHFNQPLLSSNTSQESGKEIVKRNDYWAVSYTHLTLPTKA